MEICGTTPEASMLRSNISPYPARASIPSCMRAPPESLMPMHGAPIVMARSITLHIFSDMVFDSEPPLTVKSCAKTYTKRPSIVPEPTTTPSPGYCFFSMPKLWQRCSLNISYSSNEPSSSNMLMRSLAVYLPRACCFSMAFSPPPRNACSRFSISFFIFCDCIDISLIINN